MEDDISKNDKKERFIELRAKEYSFDYIAKELRTSKPTLIVWSKELKVDISNLRELSRDSLREQFAISRKHRLKLLSNQLNRLQEELSKRDLGDVTTPQLLAMTIKVESRIAEIDDGITRLVEESEGLPMFGDEITIESWNG